MPYNNVMLTNFSAPKWLAGGPHFSKDLMITDRNMQFMESDFSGDRGDQLLPEVKRAKILTNIQHFNP